MNMPFIPLVPLVISFILAFRLGLYRGLFLHVLIATGFFYAFLGYIYWISVTQGYFAGVSWGTSLEYSATLFTVAIMITSISYSLGIRKCSPFQISSNDTYDQNIKLPWIFKIFLIVGFLSCFFVFLDNNNRGSFFLIAYQFSDITIAALIFAAATKPKKKIYQFLSLIFVAYCLFVGFRYKLILLAFPLFILAVHRASDVKRGLLVLIAPISILLLFSIVTITRVKFSGIDLSQLDGVDYNRLLYGFFADTNILFGISSIVTYVEPNEKFVYFQPILDSFYELLPRFIFPDRDTGQQIKTVLDGLISEEGINSATTYPYFGEYINMFGYPGYWFGCVFLGLIVAKVVKKGTFKRHAALSWGCIALISVLFGYYYVSRGYLPQFVKSIVFILFPFFLMSWKYNRSLKKRCNSANLKSIA